MRANSRAMPAPIPGIFLRASTVHQRNWDLLPDQDGIVFIDSSGRLAAKAREIHVVLHGLEEIARIAAGAVVQRN